MEEVIDFFKNLLDTSDWPPRWHCGKWTEFHGWLYIISDLLIWGAYFALPVIILRYATKKNDIRFAKVYFLFAAFILACGATHFLDAVMFWFPAYRLSALLKAITAIISWVTVFSLIKMLPQAFALKTPKELQTEIDNRNKAEQELNKKITQITQAEKAAKFGHFELDVADGKTRWSDSMAQLFEVDDASTIKTMADALQFFLPEDRQGIEKRLQSFPSGNFVPAYQKIITAKGNSRIIYSYSSKLINDDAANDTIIGIAQDVTEMLQNKELLAQNRQLFGAAFDYSSMGIALVQFNGECFDANNMACEILGYTKSELIQLDFFSLIYPKDLEITLKNIQLLLDKKEVYRRSEKRLIRKDGTIIWALFSKSIVWHQNRESSFFMFQFVDISERKLLMEELQNKNESLEKSNRTLQYHVNLTSEFNNIIAHNLKGPAASLIQIAEYIDGMESKEDREFMLGKIKDLAQNIMRTLGDMKEFIEVRLSDEHSNLCNFKEVIDENMSVLEIQILQSRAQFKISLECAYVYFPLLYLKSIVFNLLSNALKYRSQDVCPLITIRTFEEGDSICLRIADNGIGINLQKYKADIFKYRKIFHKNYDSYGLGLFLTKTHLEAFNGDINVESEPGKGTTFNVHFKKQ